MSITSKIWPVWEKKRQYLLGIDPGKDNAGLAVVSHYKGYDVKIHLLHSLENLVQSLNLNDDNLLNKERLALFDELSKVLEPYFPYIDPVIMERYQGRHKGLLNELVNTFISYVHVYCYDKMPNTSVHLIVSSIWKNACKKDYNCWNPKKRENKAEGEILLPELFYSPTKTQIKKGEVKQEIILEHCLDGAMMCIWSINSQRKAKNMSPVKRYQYKGKYYYIGSKFEQ